MNKTDSLHDTTYGVYTLDSMKALTIAVLGGFSAALLAFFVHSLVINPQPDAELLVYAHQFYKTFGTKWFEEFYFIERKYPFFFLFLGSLLLHFTLWIFDASSAMWQEGMSQFEVGTVWVMTIHASGRLLIVTCAIGTLLLLQRMSRKLFSSNAAVLLLLSSPLFFVFSTAIRPHVPVAFWTVLSIFCAIKLYERKTFARGVCAFGAALAAFCTLQNGLFAFIFPVWGLLLPRFTWKQVAICIGALLCCLGLAVVLGYPFLLQSSGTASLDLGHNVPTQWNGAGFLQLPRTFLGGEIFLLLFAGASIFLALRKRITLPPIALPIVIFIVLYIAIFGMHGSTLMRYWIILLPLFALLGAPAFARAPKMIRGGFLVIVLLMYIKFAVLAIQKDTYELAMDAVDHIAAPISVQLPIYAHDVLPERNVPPTDANYMVAITRGATQSSDWHECKRITASKITDNLLFLWNEVPWSYYHLIFTKRLGENVSVYCKEGIELF